MILAHEVLFWVAFAAMLVGASLVFLRGGLPRLGWLSVTAGSVALALSAAARWTVTGHPPMFGTFENTMASSWALSVTALMLSRSDGEDDDTARGLAVFAALTLVYGLFFSRAPYPLTISEQNLIVELHVVAAWFAYAYLVSASLRSGLWLLGRGGPPDDRRLFRGIGLGFTAFSIMLALGSLYTWMLFSEWYRWELVEVLSAATWIAYGALIHARLMFAWQGRKLHVAALALLPLVILSFWAWSVYAGTYHHFDITVLRAG